MSTKEITVFPVALDEFKLFTVVSDLSGVTGVFLKGSNRYVYIWLWQLPRCWYFLKYYLKGVLRILREDELL